jgi:hypothetical protein
VRRLRTVGIWFVGGQVYLSCQQMPSYAKPTSRYSRLSQDPTVASGWQKTTAARNKVKRSNDTDAANQTLTNTQEEILSSAPVCMCHARALPGHIAITTGSVIWLQGTFHRIYRQEPHICGMTLFDHHFGELGMGVFTPLFSTKNGSLSNLWRFKARSASTQ